MAAIAAEKPEIHRPVMEVALLQRMGMPMQIITPAMLRLKTIELVVPS